MQHLIIHLMLHLLKQNLAGCCALYYKSRMSDGMDSSYILVKCYLLIKSMQPWVVQPEVEKNFQGRALESGRKPSSFLDRGPGIV